MIINGVGVLYALPFLFIVTISWSLVTKEGVRDILFKSLFARSVVSSQVGFFVGYNIC